MTEDTFVSHLVELRDRMVRSLIAILIGFALLWIWPGYAALYDFLALPLIQTLPPGSKMIATGVITPFLIPLKVGLMAAFLLVLPYVLVSGLGVCCARPLFARKKAGVAAGDQQHGAIFYWRCLLLLHRLQAGVQFYRRLCTSEHHACTGYRTVFVVRAHHVSGVWGGI